jgi:ketosteroid isomerase-like protein
MTMRTEQAPVTGRESPQQLTPQMRALSQFYRALNTRDMGLMAQTWAFTDEAVMDNPVGGIKRGWDEIKAVYERVFGSSGPYWFEFYDYSYHEAGDIFYVVGRERGEYTGRDALLALAIRTTRIFRRIDGTWRQVHHHGSMDDPELLAAYVRAVAANR